VRPGYYAGEKGNIGYLFYGFLLLDMDQHILIGIDEPWHLHTGLIARRDLPPVIVDLR